MTNATDNINKKNKKKNKEIKISGVLFYLLMPVLIILSRIIYGVKIDKSRIKRLKGPFLVLGNHTTPIDFLFFTGSIYPKKMTFVVASNMYYTKVYGSIIRKYNCIPKRQFTADFSCIKLIKKFMDSGTSVLLFPEGRVTIDGTTGNISDSIGKLVKWLNYPVIAGITSGGYASNPKWGKARKAKIRVKMDSVLSKEDIGKLSADEITAVIREKLRHNDNRTIIDNGWRINGTKLAVGLEKLLYKCPKCGAEFKNTTKGDYITCQACGNRVKYCHSGKLQAVSEGGKAYELINEWADYQRDGIRAQVENPDFVLSDKVKFVINNPKTNEFTDIGEGILSVSKEGIHYRDEKNEYSFKIENHQSLAFKMGDDLEVSEEENIYRFIFLDGAYSTKYVMAIEAIYNKYYSK